MKNGISIGEDTWIDCGDLTDGLSSALEIDSDLAPVMPFIEKLETACVAGCCGMDAFVLWPEEIENTTSKFTRLEREELSLKFARVSNAIKGLPNDVVVSNRLNQYFRKNVLLEILTHIKNVIDRYISESLSKNI